MWAMRRCSVKDDVGVIRCCFTKGRCWQCPNPARPDRAYCRLHRTSDNDFKIKDFLSSSPLSDPTNSSRVSSSDPGHSSSNDNSKKRKREFKKKKKKEEEEEEDIQEESDTRQQQADVAEAKAEGEAEVIRKVLPNGVITISSPPPKLANVPPYLTKTTKDGKQVRVVIGDQRKFRCKNLNVSAVLAEQVNIREEISCGTHQSIEAGDNVTGSEVNRAADGTNEQDNSAKDETNEKDNSAEISGAVDNSAKDETNEKDNSAEISGAVDNSAEDETNENDNSAEDETNEHDNSAEDETDEQDNFADVNGPMDEINEQDNFAEDETNEQDNSVEVNGANETNEQDNFAEDETDEQDNSVEVNGANETNEQDNFAVDETDEQDNSVEVNGAVNETNEQDNFAVDETDEQDNSVEVNGAVNETNEQDNFAEDEIDEQDNSVEVNGAVNETNEQDNFAVDETDEQDNSVEVNGAVDETNEQDKSAEGETNEQDKSAEDKTNEQDNSAEVENCGYYVSQLLPLLKHLNWDQIFELEIESDFQGKLITEMLLPVIECSYDVVFKCNHCQIRIEDMHRICMKCNCKLCVKCCQALRHQSLTGGDTTVNSGNHKMKTVVEIRDDKFICPASLGGCAEDDLKIKCLVPIGWKKAIAEGQDR